MVENPTVEYEMLEQKLGYIALSSFEEVSSEQFITAVDDLEAQGMEGLIIDLRKQRRRRHPGGGGYRGLYPAGGGYVGKL